MTTTVYLIRHGRTIWNKEQIFRGRRDVPLDDMGRQQARLLAEHMSHEQVAAVYAAPLSRARETAQILAEPHRREVHILEAFNDLRFGDWEGLRRDDVKDRYPDLYRLWEQEPQCVIFPGGERLADVRVRAVAAVRDLVVTHPGERIVVVTHRVVLKVLICALIGLDDSHFWNITQDTTAVNRFDFQNGRWIVSLLNDTCHLRVVRPHEPAPDF